MTDAERSRMNELSLQIQQERDYVKFEQLTRELYALVARKEHRFPERQLSPAHSTAWKLLPAVANRLIKPLHGVEKIEIKIPDADDLFSEIRVENSFVDDQGNLLAIQPGARLDVRLEAPAGSFTSPAPHS